MSDALHHHFAELGSTNDELTRLAAAGAPSGTAVSADRQHAGRGRRGHTWESLAGSHVFLSVLHRSRLPLAELSGLTLEVGLVVSEVLEGLGFVVALEWPNDLLVAGKKVGGVLCEAVDDGRGGSAVVIGVGLNVDVSALPDALADRATALRAHGPVERDALLAALIAALRRGAEAYELRRAPRTDAWAARAVTIGQRVQEVVATAPQSSRDGAGREPPSARVGLVTGIARDGALLLLWDGSSEVERVFAGELTALHPLSTDSHPE
jgi:BirA family biotin operon repressor/biotin-[acetyl-CoA-carboxylase] ligase